jgi:putative salt-induced outer membrane protein
VTSTRRPLSRGALALLPLLSGMMVSISARADDAPPPPPQGIWTGKGQAGYTSSQGNSQAKSATAAIDMSLLEDPWKHAFHLEGLYGQSAGVTSAERWATEWQSNYDFTKDVYGFGGLRFQHDLYNGFLYQESVTAGAGYKVFDTDRMKLDVQVGAGYKKLRPQVLTKDAAGEVTSRTLQPIESEAIGTVGVNYSQTLTSTTTLTDKLLVETGSNDTLVTNALALALKISTKLALSVGYTLQNNSSPPAGAKKLDTLETLNLVYSF